MILVDSSVWIDYFNGTETPATKKLDGLLGVQPIYTGDLFWLRYCKGSGRMMIIKPQKRCSAPCLSTPCWVQP